MARLQPKTEGDKDLGSELREYDIRRLVLQVARYPPGACYIHHIQPSGAPFSSSWISYAVRWGSCYMMR